MTACLLALCVVVLGAYVRLSDAGLGCPDWPGCYGVLTVPQSQEEIVQAQNVYPDRPLERQKAWKEMFHRYAAGTLGLLVVALFFLGWRARKLLQVSPWLPTVLLGLVIFQALLGMWTVTLLLKPAIVTAHLLGGMGTLALLTWIAHRHLRHPARPPALTHMSRLCVHGALIVLFAQIFLGGWTSTNYAALACTDFPACHGALLPQMDFSNAYHLIRELGQGVDGKPLGLPALTAIQWTHRLGALATLIYLGVLGFFLLNFRQLKKPALLMLLLLAVQICIGIANLVLHLPLALAVAHNLGAALLLIIIVIINSRVTGLKNREAL